MDLSFQVFPVENVRKPSTTIAEVEINELKLPTEAKGIDDEDVPGERDETIIHAVWVFKVNLTMFDIITTEEKELSFSVEF